MARHGLTCCPAAAAGRGLILLCGCGGWLPEIPLAPLTFKRPCPEVTPFAGSVVGWRSRRVPKVGVGVPGTPGLQRLAQQRLHHRQSQQLRVTEPGRDLNAYGKRYREVEMPQVGMISTGALPRGPAPGPRIDCVPGTSLLRASEGASSHMSIQSQCQPSRGQQHRGR
jgi:hypothetical protein